MTAPGPVLRSAVARGSFTRISPAKAMPARRAAVHPSAPAARCAEGDDCSRLGAADLSIGEFRPISHRGATPPPAAAGWSTGRLPPSGMRIEQPVAPNQASWHSTRPCAPMWRSDWLAPWSERLRPTCFRHCGTSFGNPGCPSNRGNFTSRGVRATGKNQAVIGATFTQLRECGSPSEPRSLPAHARQRRGGQR